MRVRGVPLLSPSIISTQFHTALIVASATTILYINYYRFIICLMHGSFHFDQAFAVLIYPAGIHRAWSSPVSLQPARTSV